MNILITGGAGSVGYCANDHQCHRFISPLEVIPAREWHGAQFLADAWELSAAKAEQRFAYHSLFSPSIARQSLEKALAQYREDLKGV